MFRTTGWNIWPSLLGAITPDLPPFSILEQWEQCSGVDQKKPNKKVLFSQQEGAGSASVYAALIRGEKKVRQASHSGQTLVQICWKKKKSTVQIKKNQTRRCGSANQPEGAGSASVNAALISWKFFFLAASPPRCPDTW